MTSVQIIPGQIIVPDDKIAVLVGPIPGSVTLADGRTVDVSGDVAVVDTQDDADEVAHLVGLHYKENGHPDDIEYDPKKKAMVQREFDYQPPAKFKNYKKFGES